MTFLGRLDDDALQREYERCTAFVMPSRDEGFGFVFVEAMRAARACIGGRGAAAEIIVDGDTGLLVEPDDRAQLLQASCGCCAIARQPAAMGARGRARFLAAVHRRALPRPLHGPAPGDRVNILGLNAYHGDVSAALVRDGQLVAAVEEERFRRIKHCAGFPRHALHACLEMGGIAAADVDVFAVSRDPRAHLLRKALVPAPAPPAGHGGVARAQPGQPARAAGDDRRRRSALDEARVRPRLRFVEHHPAHLASAAFVSPFDEAAVCAIDGFGDFVSTSWGRVAGPRLSVDGHVFFPHSLGLLYLAITQYLGFPNYGDEFKVMGLAPYGEPRYAREIESLVHLRDDGGFELDLSLLPALVRRRRR